MAIEIERKFLVNSSTWLDSVVSTEVIKQGYLLATGPNIIRVRIIQPSAWYPELVGAVSSAFITIKNRIDALSCHEYEYSIPVEDAEAIFKTCQYSVEKIRHHVNLDGAEWIVDVFGGKNAGLVCAEYEAATEEAVSSVAVPEWCYMEATGDSRYSNAALAKSPVSTW